MSSQESTSWVHDDDDDEDDEAASRYDTAGFASVQRVRYFHSPLSSPGSIHWLVIMSSKSALMDISHRLLFFSR